MAVRRDLKGRRGDTFTITIIWKHKTRGPYNITGWTGKAQFRSVEDGAVEKTFDTSYFTIVGLEGATTFKIPADDMAGFTWTRMKYDIQITGIDNPPTVKTLLYGEFLLEKDITQ